MGAKSSRDGSRISSAGQRNSATEIFTASTFSGRTWKLLPYSGTDRSSALYAAVFSR